MRSCTQRWPPRAAYAVHQPDSCGSTHEGTTNSDSTQDELESDEWTVTKTGTITTVTGQCATAMTALRRRATGTC